MSSNEPIKENTQPTPPLTGDMDAWDHGVTRKLEHSDPDPDPDPDLDPDAGPAPEPVPDDVPPPAHAPVREPSLPAPPIKAQAGQ